MAEQRLGTVPKNILSQSAWMDDPVELREESRPDDRRTAEPERLSQLAELLEGITNENLHWETDVGSLVGNEVW